MPYTKMLSFFSVWHSMSSTSVTDSVFDMDWSYQGGSGDLREVKREARKQAKEQYAKDEVRLLFLYMPRFSTTILCIFSWRP